MINSRGNFLFRFYKIISRCHCHIKVCEGTGVSSLLYVVGSIYECLRFIVDALSIDVNHTFERAMCLVRRGSVACRARWSFIRNRFRHDIINAAHGYSVARITASEPHWVLYVPSR